MYKKKLSGALSFFCLVAWVNYVFADEIAWDKVIGADPDKLNPEQKNRVASNLRNIENTWGCKGKISECLAKGDLTARRHAGFVVRMVRKGKTDSFVQKGVALRKTSAHPAEVFNIDLSDHPLSGNPGAKVTFVEYACFECPFCADLAPKLKELEKKLGDKLVHYYKFFPVRSHPRGVQTALAGLAAYRQGKFWKMHDLMFSRRAKLEDDDLVEYAAEAGLDLDKFKKDAGDEASMRYIERDKLEGMRFGVEGTPTFFVNGKMYVGSNEFDEVKDRIAEELDIVEGRIP